MTKIWKAGLAALFLFAAAEPASAQIGFSIAGGPSFALGDNLSGFDTGYHVQGSASLSLPLLPIGVRIDGHLNRFPGEAADFQSLAGSVNAVLTIPSIGITPYLIGGVGMYSNKVDFDDSDDESGSDMGVNVGAGVRLGLPGLGVFVEGRLHNVFSEGSSTRFAPLSVGLRF